MIDTAVIAMAAGIVAAFIEWALCAGGRAR